MNSTKILIADDHQTVRRSLRRLMESTGWQVCAEAADGAEAVEKARQLRPDIVLMDVGMPRMNGIEATRAIRKEIPAEVIIVSESDPSVLSLQAKQAGARRWVEKSRVAQDLIPAIEKVLGRSVGRSSVRTKKAPVKERQVAPEWISGGGEMGERMRNLDWAKTPLGPIEKWPQSLKTSISICLASRFPIVMYWGPEYVVLYNDAYSTILGSKHPWALGQRCRECWAEIWGTIGPMLDQVVSSSQATWSDDLLLMLRRHGYPEECYFSFSFSPIRVETGENGGVFTAVMETTDNVIGERRLRTLRDLAAKAVDAATERDAWRISIETIGHNPYDIPFALLLQTKGGNEPAKIVELAGISKTHELCDSLSTPGSQLFELTARAAESKELVEINVADLPFQLPRGGWKSPPDSALLLPVGDSGSDGVGTVLLVGVSPHKRMDVPYHTFFELVARQVSKSIADARAHEDERNRAETLAELNRAKTTFFSNVSHEFRTPLTLMLGPLEDALSSTRLADEERERLQLAHRNSLRLLKLVNALLDFSRIEAGRLQASYQPTDVCRLTADLASVFRSAIERAGLNLVVNCEPIDEAVYVDHEMWEKIVFNLLSNAFKFTFEGEIEVTVRRVADFAELSVRDTGSGIPETELPHLFQRFFRVSGARGRTFEGSGIGLSLVEELTKLHGGTVRVESEVNRGSTFTVAIPLGKDHLPPRSIEAPRTQALTHLQGEAYVQEALSWLEEPAHVSPNAQLATALLPDAATASPHSGERRPRILLAEDNRDLREYMRRLLREQYDVTAVSDGEAALNSARAQAPDLILCDVMMPRVDGVSLLKAIRADEKLRGVPLILLSARAGEESRIEGLHHGADDYLVKPFSARELQARVSSQLAMSRMRKQSGDLEHRLRLDSELLAAIVASSEDAIVSKNLDGVITSWNRGAENMFGYTAAEAVGKHITLIIPPDRLPEEAQIISKLRRGEKIEHFETVRVRKGGDLLNIAVTISPIRDATGRVVGASKVARDVTQRKRQGERFEMVRRASQVGFWFCDLPFDKLNWDEHVKEHFWLPQDAEVTIDTFYERLHLEDRERTREAIAYSNDTNTPYDIEYRTVGPHGQIKWIRAIGRTYYDVSGKPIRFDGVTLDITEKRRAQEREREITVQVLAANAKFRAVFEQTNVFAGIMSKDGVLIDCNRVAVETCGYTADEVLGKQFWQTRWWRNFPESQEKIRAATPLAAQGTPYQELLRYSWADGTVRLVDFALYPIVNDEGEILFLHPTGVDITDLKRAEEKYRQLAETLEQEVKARTIELENRNAEVLAQSELLREFSHRLLTAQDGERRHIARELHDSAGQTLTVLGISIAQLVQKLGRQSPELANFAEQIQDTVKQLHREIRTTSYLLHPPLLDETGLASALSWYVQGLGERSDLQIELNVSEDFGRLPRDLELTIFRLVQEGLTNIHRHSGSKEANIHISRVDGLVSVHIQDRGKGMPAARLADIQSGGSGVGIRGMRERLRHFRGKLEINSDDSGTRISATIPVSKTDGVNGDGIEPMQAAV